MEAKSYEFQTSSLYFGDDSYSCLLNRVPEADVSKTHPWKELIDGDHNIFIDEGTGKFLPSRIQENVKRNHKEQYYHPNWVGITK